jgi:predicted O-methyltransferase YrrM
MQEQWTAVDTYFSDLLAPHDEALEAALRDCEATGLPAIQVSTPLGKLLHLLARTQAARSILEIGTLGGYSAIWMARALPPEGRLVTLELDPKHAEVARRNLERAGVADRVEIRVGKALESLPRIAEEGRPPFDLVFIDADKRENVEYFRWALRLTRLGGLIVIDNVVRRGQVADADSTDANVQGTRRVLEMLAAEPRVSATAIQTVGSKGYDGFALAVVVGGESAG